MMELFAYFTFFLGIYYFKRNTSYGTYFFWVVLLFFGLMPTAVLGQSNISISEITVNDGLSQGMIFDIIQSRDGFIWIATKDGLNRYDGSRFKIYTTNSFDPFAIYDSEVRSLFEDSRGWIWLSLSTGVDVLDPNTNRFFHFAKTNYFPYNNWRGSFLESKDGKTIWFTGLEEIWKFSIKPDLLEKAYKNGESNIYSISQIISLSSIPSLTGKPVEALLLFLTQDNQLLIGTGNNGVYNLDINSDKITPYLLVDDSEILCISQSNSSEILLKTKSKKDKRQSWISIKNGIIKSQEDTTKIYYQSRVIFDNKGFFWTYRSNKIQKWDTKAFFNNGKPMQEVSIDFLASNTPDNIFCTAFYIDRSGLLWVGLSGYGLLKINTNGNKFKTYLTGVSHRNIIEHPNGDIFSYQMLFKKFKNKNFQQGLPNDIFPLSTTGNASMNIAYDREGNTWGLDVDSTLNIIYAKTKTKKSFVFWGDGLICNKNGNMMAVNAKGILEINPKSFTNKFFPFDKPQVKISEYSHFIYEDVDKTLWIFGYKGLIKASPFNNGYQFTYYTNNTKDKTSISINTVLSVLDDPLEPKKYLWVGTKGGGLNQLNKQTGQFKLYTTKDGLPNNVIYGILAENTKPINGESLKNVLWMSTNKGLCRFNITDGSIKNFTIKDGLQSNEFNSASYLKVSDGSLIFGGINGINVVYPDSLVSNTHIPQSKIVELYVNNKNWDIQDKTIYNFSYDQNLISFEFAALEYTNPFQNQYKYQLVGVDKEWVNLGYKNNIQFANLSPGNYTFKVIGSNNDGVWGRQAAEIKFTIDSPWWNSIWAYFIYLFLIGLGIRAIYQYRVIEAEREKALLSQQAKQLFLANMSHEIRTPMNAIKGMTDILIRRNPKEYQKEYLNGIKHSSESLLVIINDILDVSKIEAGKVQLENNPFSVNEVVNNVHTIMQFKAQEKGLQLKKNIPIQEINVKGDVTRLRQILINLIGNAIKFTEKGMVTTTMKLEQDAEKLNLHFIVSDTGIGIEKDAMDRIFESFEQAYSDISRKFGGTGLGLSISKKLVEMHNGKIWVESEKHKGSHFHFIIPYAIAATKTEGIIADLHSNIADALKDIRILLVEDNAFNIVIATEELTDAIEGVYVEVAENGLIAVEKLKSLTFDIILMDVQMPVMNGFEATKIIRNLGSEKANIPIVAMTANVLKEEVDLCYQAGMDNFIGKPFETKELLNKIFNLINK